MTLGSLGLGFLLALPLTALICLLPFCGHDEIYHFCDAPAVTRPACADIRGHQATRCVSAGVAAAALPFLLILSLTLTLTLPFLLILS